MNYNPLLLIDFYKATHAEQYNPNITKIVSYFTPRMSRLEDDFLVMFGLQAYIKEYLIESFNENFFEKKKVDVLEQYYYLMNSTLGKDSYGIEKIRNLHDLGYLPIQIRALPEGTKVPVGVPMFEISNTHDDFAWVTNALESALSASLWHPMISANVGYKYRGIVERYYDKTVDWAREKYTSALGDFSFRGQESIESGIKASAAWCLSFKNTATVPAIMYLANYYNTPVENIAKGAISTEHSVMCSNFAIDGDEITGIRRLLTEIYPNKSFSMVSDSYDYWNLVENILPQLKEEILAHEGYLGIRGDSGDPVQVVTQTVLKLWGIFGGTTNTRGYKVLNPHVKAIYGDSITPQRCEAIYKVLEAYGFSCENVVLGVGSFSFQCLEQDGKFLPYTRDTFGIAIKATYCEKDGSPYPIFKNPKESSFKKSQKGCCWITEADPSNFICQDGYSHEQVLKAEKDGLDCMKTVFENGNMVKEYTLDEIRKTLNPVSNW